MKKSTFSIIILFSSLIVVILPVYADRSDFGNMMNNAVGIPKDTHVCTNIPDGRQDCTEQHYQCDTSSLNGTCVGYHVILTRMICTEIPVEERGCLVINVNDPIPPMPKYELNRPMNTTNLDTQIQNVTTPQQPLPVNQTNRAPIVPVFADSNSTNPAVSQINNSQVIQNVQNTFTGPSWIDKVFSMYDQGQLSEKEIITLIKWLIENKIMGR